MKKEISKRASALGYKQAIIDMMEKATFILTHYMHITDISNVERSAINAYWEDLQQAAGGLIKEQEKK